MKARAQITVPGRISDAEALWFDTSRWATFVDGFHHVVSRDEQWPQGGTLVWDSTAGGRGRVAEFVERHDPRVEHVTRIEEEALTGTQRLAFAALDNERVRITLELSYELKTKPAGFLTPVVDALFIRPRQRESLARTLSRFARELAQDRELSDTP